MCLSNTILFVDDDADDRELFADTLKHVAPSVSAVFAENGVKALEYLESSIQGHHLPCLIVLDINMPFLNGKETYQRIKNELKLETVPVIIFTSSQNPADEQLFSKLGVEFISKPSEYAYFNQAVSRMVKVCASN